MKMMLVLIWPLLAIMVYHVSSEEPQCSRFEFQEKLLEKSVRMDVKMDGMAKSIGDLKEEISDCKVHTERLQSTLGNAISELEELSQVKKLFKSEVENNQILNHEVADIRGLVQNISEEFEYAKNFQGKPETALIVFYSTLKTHARNLQRNQAVLFDNVIVNIGSGFDKDSGEFIAPFPGIYYFSSTLLSTNDGEIGFSFSVNGITKSLIYAHGTEGRHDSGSQTMIVELNKGDRVSVRSDANALTVYGSHYSSFSGYLITKS